MKFIKVTNEVYLSPDCASCGKDGVWKPATPEPLYPKVLEAKLKLAKSEERQRICEEIRKYFGGTTSKGIEVIDDLLAKLKE